MLIYGFFKVYALVCACKVPYSLCLVKRLDAHWLVYNEVILVLMTSFMMMLYEVSTEARNIQGFHQKKKKNNLS